MSTFDTNPLKGLVLNVLIDMDLGFWANGLVPEAFHQVLKS